MFTYLQDVSYSAVSNKHKTEPHLLPVLKNIFLRIKKWNITKSMEYIPSWRAYSRSASQETPRLLWNL